MPDQATTVAQVASASDWNTRVALIRKVPEDFGDSLRPGVYAEIAKRVYVPSLAPDFAYVSWPERYELAAVELAYKHAHELTRGFENVDLENLQQSLLKQPIALRIYRLLLGLTTSEFAEATKFAAQRHPELVAVGKSKVSALETGRPCDAVTARSCAVTIDEAMNGLLFGEPPTQEVRAKIEKPDTREGWTTVRGYAKGGVPLAVFLHQRYYGGAFRQLLDATSSRRGDVLEDAVEEAFQGNGILFVRTGAANQEEIGRRFGLTVRPAPDFVIFDRSDALRAILECKIANDGGTARDKAARFNTLRGESSRLGGVPVFAVLAGLGWTRTADALGPVVRDTDGRVFALPTLKDMLTVQPFPLLVHRVAR
jgi:hypothetical protein